MSILQALRAFNGQLYAAWKSDVGDDHLYTAQFNGRKWTAGEGLTGNSDVGPALAVFDGAIWAAWKGQAGDERLYLARGTGILWAAPSVIPGVASSMGPSLATYNNKLYAAWKGMGSDQALWFASFDGTNWSAQATIPNTASSVGPSLATFNGKLYAAWRGQNIDQTLWWASFDGANWSAQAPIPGTASSVGPSLAVYAGKLYAAWKGVTGDESLWYATFDGTKWSAQTQIAGVASSLGPALAAYAPPGSILTKLGGPGELFAMWKGETGDPALWYASFNGSKWSAQATVGGKTGQDVPQNTVGLRMQYQQSVQWCWIAVATSVNHFYNPASRATQCGIMTTVGHNINGFPANTSACPSPSLITSTSGVWAALADPYAIAALYVLDNPALGIPVQYLKSGGVGDALNVYGNWNQPGLPSMTLAQIASEVGAGRPICASIQWNAGGQHVVAVVGVLDDQLLILDPVSGESVIQYEQFPTNYSGGATLVQYALTKKGS